MAFIARLKKILHLVIVASLSIFFIVNLSVRINANEIIGGIAISGSFNNQTIKMVPGESFTPDNVTIIVFNTYREIDENEDVVSYVNVKVNLNAYVLDENRDYVYDDLLQFQFFLANDGTPIEQGELEIPGNSNIEIGVNFTTSEELLPGNYEISVGAELVPNQSSGIVAVPVVRQKARLQVFGEAGSFNIQITDAFGQPFVGQIDVFRVENTELFPASSAFSDTISDRVVPGVYRISVTHVFQENGFQVLVDEFEIRNNDDLNLTFKVQTTFLDSIVATPLLAEDDTLLNAIINYRIRNVYEEIEDVDIYLNVYLDGVMFETILIQNLALLSRGLTSLSWNYVPQGGWTNGVYAFVIQVVAKDLQENPVTILDSDAYSINVDSIPDGSIPAWIFILGASILLAFITTIVIYVIRNKEKDTDIVCLDNDPAYLEALSKLIDGGKDT